MDSAGFLIQTASALHRHGVHVEVVTPRYASSWPEEFMFREFAVHRPAAAPRSDWSMGRYIRHLSNWLRQQAESFDVMFVDAIRDESVAAIEASRSSGCATILRCSRWGIHRDPAWWQTSRSARRCGATGKMADAVIAKSAACQRALLADGYAATRIQRIEHGFAAGPTRSAESRRLARKALGLVNSDLATHGDSPVVICTARMTRESGVSLLVNAASHLIARYPDLRLWFIGDGPHRDWMYETMRGDGVRASIAMPGSFCDVDDLFAAADVFLQTDDDGLDYFLPNAISAELPIVTLDTESTRAVIYAGSVDTAERRLAENDPNSLVEWCPAATSKYIRLGLVRVLDDLPGYQAKASQLRRLLVRTRPQSETISAYVDLMERLTRSKSPNRRGSSVEAMS
jgi:glycosyltransferase involved in cell wall biosynthesis